jgi:hypothetical protein
MPPRAVHFSFSRQSVAVNQYYFDVHDAEWGPAFVKVGSYQPYPVRVCLNGNEWLKRQLRKEAIPFDGLDNGFLWCADPDRLQQLADSLGRPMYRRSSIAGSSPSLGHSHQPIVPPAIATA